MKNNTNILHICNLCNKKYSSYQSLWIHNKKYHKTFNNILQPTNNIIHLPNNILQTFNNIIQLSNNNLQLSNNISQTSDIILHNNICKYCKKILSHRNSRWRHEKSCKEKKKLIINNNKIQLLEEKNKQLEEMINKLALEIKNKNLHQTNNGTINEIGTINNIQIVSLGREDLSKLSIKEQKNILKFGSSSLKKIIADVNFNPKIPEQQNIKLTNLAKKTCKQYDEQSKNFIEVPKDRLICSLINIRTGDLIEIHEEFKEDGNRCHDSVNYIINVVNNYQDNSDNKDFEKKYLELKKEIELLIYNKTKELNNKK